MRKLFIAGAILLCAALPAGIWAQSSNATLGGSVADASGALIPGVTVTATNTGTGIATMVFSNESGSYQFASLQPGTYTVSAELPGFQTQTYNTVALGISQQVRLNFKLEVSTVAQAVEVSVAADTLLATTSASVGNVLPEYKVSDLPLGNRSVLDLVGTTAGTQDSSFAGLPQGFTMTTRDGIPINHGRYNVGIYAQTFTTPDLVEEVRVIVAPADAELGRGSGQVQLQTRSGTNEFHGALFWVNRNSVWDAISARNNFDFYSADPSRRGDAPVKDWANRNQFGGRLGGPIVRNKTFFFFLFEGQRFREKAIVTPEVLTDQARQGVFRYFAGRRNGNAFSTTPSVDLRGNPLPGIGDLRSVNVFDFDPLRPGFDPSGMVPRLLEAMPRANDFTVGDGLNTAGHRWVRTLDGSGSIFGGADNANRDQYNFKIDHNFNPSHKLSMVMTREHSWADANLSEWPNGYHGWLEQEPQIYTANVVSTLSPTVVNEFRFGLRRGRLDSLQAYDHPKTGQDAAQWLGFVPGPGGPVSPGGTPFILEGSLFGDDNIINDSNGSIGNTTPLWTWGDSLSWTTGQHAFKTGFDLRLGAGDAWNSDEIVPNVHLGYPGAPAGGRDYYCNTCGIPVTGISTTTIPGINGSDIGRVRDLLTDLAGSVANVSQAFSLRPDPNDIRWLDYPNYYQKYRDFHQNEFAAFFKDDWKIHPSLSLNLGGRWEWYGVPYEGNGMMARPKDGNVWGLSGSSFADWYRPGVRGELTTVEFVGKHSPNPNTPLYNNDWNNFGPAVGFSWQIPWFQRDTVVRGGYSVTYQGRFAGGDGLGIDIFVGLAPGTNQFTKHPTTLDSELDLRALALPIPEKAEDGKLLLVPLNERSQDQTGYDINQRSQYVQNFSLELQRELARNLTMEVRYIGTKGTKLLNVININRNIIEENGFLDAFMTTRSGGNAPLFDEMLMGLRFTGVGTVNGATLTGSQALRQFSSTRSDIANGDPHGLADFLNQSASITGDAGGILRANGFAENFFAANPQYDDVNIRGMGNNSTYHSLQLAVTKRLSYGFTNQMTYTWSRSLGDRGELDPRNRRLNKTVLSNHRTHDIRANGTWELPFGPNRLLLGAAPGWVSRLVEGWQLGGVFNWTSGAPLNITASPNPFTGSATGNFPDIAGEFPKGIGKLTDSQIAGRKEYFSGLQRVDDPGAANVTSLQGLQSRFSNTAIADASGNIILVNPRPGTIGNMGQYWIEGPGDIAFDANLMKRFRIDESRMFIMRLDAINVLNHPNWGNPTVSINSNNFGLVDLPRTGNRQFTFNLRLEF